MNNMTMVKRLLLSLLTLVLLFSCEDKMDEHYKVPDWLKGSVWDVLSNNNEQYSIFQEGIELAGFKPIVEGKASMTVMAPNDAAFKTYLDSKGYASIKEMDKEELKKLIGFHILYYSYNKENLINFRPIGGNTSSEDDKEINAGLYYKFRSRSNDGLSVIVDPKDKRDKNVYHLDRFVPVFSHKFFNTKKIDAKSNYEFFYPNSTWSGENGFNVSNAAVNEYQVLADNGYIYQVDKVLEPLETIHTELNSKDRYSEFSRIYDSYSAYTFDQTLTDNYAKSLGVDSLFLHDSQLAPIALEWPTTYYYDISSLSSIAYTLFAPTNEALDNFFKNYWAKGGYNSINEVDPLSISHFLSSFYVKTSPLFPEELTKRDESKVSSIVKFDLTAVKDKAMCVNGTFYGIDAFSIPDHMSSVAGPAFRDKEFASYLYILSGAGMLDALMSQNNRYITFIPSNEQLEAEGITLNEYSSGKILEKEGDDGELVAVGTSEMERILNMHVINFDGQLNKSGAKVYPTQLAFNYWYVKDGKIASSASFTKYANFDNLEDPFTPFKEITNEGNAPWSNGRAYSYEYPGIFKQENSDGLNYKLSISNEVRDPYYLFSQLLKKAGLVEGNKIKALDTYRFVVFVPTNSTLQAALDANQIPGVQGGLNGTINQEILAKYMLSYFLSTSNNVITSYPYPGSDMKNGSYTTPASTRLIYTDNGTSLGIQLEGGNGNISRVITDYDLFPFAYHDGGFHFIDSIL